MAFTIRRSGVESDYLEVWQEEQMVKELFAPFLIRKFPKSFESLEEIERWLQEAEWKIARFSAYRMVALRSHAGGEIFQKLERKRFSPAVCERSVEELKRNGYLQDEKEAVLREFRRGYGPHYIRLKLRSKGLNADSVSRTITDAMQREKIREWVLKLSPGSDRTAKQKTVRALQRRGFDLDLIIKELSAIH